MFLSLTFIVLHCDIFQIVLRTWTLLTNHQWMAAIT